MTNRNRLNLLAEKTFLADQIEKLPRAAILTRKSLESRMKDVLQELTLDQMSVSEPARVQLTFNGQPVIASYGVFAEFGTKAVGIFTEIINAIAASLNTALAPKGPVPNKEQYQLIITGTAIGSFGFELEEPPTGQLHLEGKTPISQAVTKTLKLLNSSLNGDEEFAESASEIDKRALDKIRSFLETLSSSKAFCTIIHEKQNFRFKSVEEVRNSLDRLSVVNFYEEEISVIGSFNGYLPKERTLEFYISETAQIIKCKVAPSVQDATKINDHLNSTVKIKITKKIIGTGTPRYIMIETPDWDSITLTFSELKK